MLLKYLIQNLQGATVTGPTELDIAHIAYDSRRVKPGSLFFALRGEKADGRAYVEPAIAAGAVAVLGEDIPSDPRLAVINVPDARAAMADAAAAFYQFPAQRLKMLGVTGTNGKTTTTFLIKHICEKEMLRCGLLGTVRYEIGDRILPAARTTPESLDVFEMLSQMRNTGCKAAVMEVSSHALSQNRVRGIEWDCAVFTNLTQDHLDYHGTMEKYFEAKSLLFTSLAAQKKKAAAVVNGDDRYGQRLARMCAGPVITYGLGARVDFRATDVKTDFSGTSYHLDAAGKSFLVRLPLIGRFNVYNSLAAIAAASAIGIEVRHAVVALASAPHVPGRLEAAPVKRQFRVFVDYAHTDDALINVMKTLRELSPNRLIVLFGCGGNRDKAKRPKMAAAVDELADWAIITSDNPRKEEPEAIIEDIKKGFRGRNYEVIADRREAIFRAVAMAQPRDIVLLAGKGHETYQEFADHTVPFDDVHVATQAVEATPMEVGYKKEP
ncbi:MAG TPA: UDP-N-acetylmuramoyl-L-alanyl-D-glutamate--2,6-diaminopimelate ligase [Chthoniobacteraceae bacterium]|jgi:UDP-N-acetylmuramoyl-L-alanyl-D-glutamate--2,6-diaminopimelate ligase|nr:UDP-N-acetylmuramoyl-L-alanyl-D-glutamate--2,6-diaminopimelate ligase [Chthoniobacteraceae bacterium]